MNYSQVSISNLALNRIGARGNLTSINDNSPNAVKCLMVWDAVFQEVLSERDWKFSKTRQVLQLSPITPLYTWKFAWALPADFLRVVRPRRRQENRDYLWLNYGAGGCGWYSRHDPPFWPFGWDYIVETLTQGWTITPGNPPVPWPPTTDPPTTAPGKFALTNYGGQIQGTPAAMTYIRLITDYTQLMPGFVNCLAYRLAMELCIGVTEDKSKFQLMEEKYKDSLNSAEAQNETMDYQHDEDGSDSWERAGRNANVFGGGYW